LSAVFTNLTATNATTTNLFSTNATVTTLNSGTSILGNASSSALTVSGQTVLATTTATKLTAPAVTLTGELRDSNGATGTPGQVLATNGASTYWTTLSNGSLANGTATSSVLYWNGSAWTENINFAASSQGNLSASGTLTVYGAATLATTTVTNLTATNATSTTGWFSSMLSALSAVFTNLTATNATTTNLVATNATSTTGWFSSMLSALNAVFTNATTTGTLVSTGNTTLATTTISHLTAPVISATGEFRDSFGATGTPGQILATNGTSTYWVATSTLGLGSGSGLTNGTATSSTLYWNGSAWVENTSLTASSLGNLSASGTLRIYGAANLANASSSALTVSGQTVLGNTTVTNATATNLTVSNSVNLPGSGIWNSNGSVGIGTTTATSTLTVQGIAGTNNALTVASSSGASLFSILSGGNVGIGTSSPNFKLDVNGIVNATALYVNGTPYVGSQWTTSGANIYYNTGSVGIGTSTPNRKFEVLDSNSVPQMRLSKTTSVYGDLTIDNSGDLTFTTTGYNIKALSNNLYICDNAGCPALTATSTAGNIFVENAQVFGNNFSINQTSSTSLGMYDHAGGLIMTFDEVQ
jgi:hypothetical protein